MNLLIDLVLNINVMVLTNNIIEPNDKIGAMILKNKNQ